MMNTILALIASILILVAAPARRTDASSAGPCKQSCRTAMNTCFKQATAVSQTQKAECTGSRPQKRRCRQTVRRALKATRAECTRQRRDVCLPCCGAAGVPANGCTTPPAQCGDGHRNPSEVCDGDDLAQQSCESLGRGHGALACRGDCAAFDTTHCAGAPPPHACGDGTVDSDEDCDPPNGNTCDASCRQVAAPCPGAGLVALANITRGGFSPGSASHGFELSKDCRTDLNLVTKPVHALRLRLLDPDGHPVTISTSPITLRAERIDAGPVSGDTVVATSLLIFSDGRISLPVTNGRYRLTSTPPCESGLLPLDLPPIAVAGTDVDLGDVRLARTPVVHVRGTITNAGTAPESVTVHARAVPAGMSAFCATTVEAVAIGSGTYTYEVAVPSGTLTIRGDAAEIGQLCSPSTPSLQHREYQDLVVVTADRVVDLPLVAPVRILGTVVGPDGDPAAGVRVRASRLDDAEASNSLCQSDERGRFTVPVAPRDRYALFLEPAPNPPLASQPVSRAADVGNADLDVGRLALAAGCRMAGTVTVPDAPRPAFLTFLTTTRSGPSCHRWVAGLPAVSATDGGFAFLHRAQ